MSSAVETDAPPAVTLTSEDWMTIPWRKLEVRVFRLQKRIFQAQRRGNVRAVHSLQRLLMKSWSARALAVRRVTQDNQGKKTAGVDGVKAVGPMVRLLFVERLRQHATLKPHPVRRVLIAKPGKPGEFRPLGIPVLLDRAHQCLAKQALEPQWESRFEGNSYGFRPGRSPHDALAAIFLAISRKAKYALDADIKGAFDNIRQPALLAKFDTFPALRRTIKGWLRAGVLHEGVFSPTTGGVPQGGTISPLLMNVALHGMEQVVAESYRPGPNRPQLIRYADDLVVFHPELAGVQAARAALEAWLAGMGLELKPSKTRITHTLENYEGQVGFDFLGCTVRQFRVGNTHSGKRRNGQLLGFKTLIMPSKEAIRRHVRTLGDLIRKHRTISQDELINLLNPRIRGWANYYRSVVASGAFTACDHHLYHQLRRWSRRRHPTKARRWIAAKYWRANASSRWNFISPSGQALYRHTQTPIRRHVKVRKEASLFDGNLPYWAQRLQHHPETGVTLGRLLRAQEGRCAACGLLFLMEDLVEIDHIQPVSQMGGPQLPNLQVLHRHCHQRKTADEAVPSRANGSP